MTRKKFKPSHLFFGIAGLLVLEAIVMQFWPAADTREKLVIVFAIVGAAINIYVAIEAIEEVKSRLRVLIFLSLIVLEFIIFFSFEYWYLILEQPASFPMLTADFLTLVLHSTMVFVFNPFYFPATVAARILYLVNTFGALSIVLFVLQNIWQIRVDGSESSKAE